MDTILQKIIEATEEIEKLPPDDPNSEDVIDVSQAESSDANEAAPTTAEGESASDDSVPEDSAPPKNSAALGHSSSTSGEENTEAQMQKLYETLSASNVKLQRPLNLLRTEKDRYRFCPSTYKKVF